MNEGAAVEATAWLGPGTTIDTISMARSMTKR